MQPVPSPSAGRGDAVLQPAYFTSVLYVRPLRDDISTLIEDFRHRFAQHDPTVPPFAVFKQLWVSKGWKWLHFKAFDDRARQTFLLVTLRLFLERLADSDPLARVIGLFGVYTFYYTQPHVVGPPLGRINHIPLPIDRFKQLIGLSDALASGRVVQLRESVLFVAATMIQDQIFYLLPPSETGSEDPRVLPREILVADPAIAENELGGRRKRGRPSRREKAKRAQATLAGLDSRLGSSPAGSPVAEESLSNYEREKAALMAALESSGNMEAVAQANVIVLERMREAEAALGDGGTVVDRNGYGGVARVERVVRAGNAGVFGLLGGAGRDGQIQGE